MPRASSYWNDPQKYRQERKQYYNTHNEYVPRKKKKEDNITNVLNTTNKKSNITISNSNAGIAGLEEYKRFVGKHYSKKYVSTKIRKMRQLGQVFFCNGYGFMTISNYLTAYKNRKTGKLSPSSLKGQQGLLNIIPYLQKCFPSPNFIIFLNPVDQSGVDILVLKDAIPYTVIELTNYEQTTYMNPNDAQRYIDNLNEWASTCPDIFKIIIVNHPENLKNNRYWKNAYKTFVSAGIGIKILR